MQRFGLGFGLQGFVLIHEAWPEGGESLGHDYSYANIGLRSYHLLMDLLGGLVIRAVPLRDDYSHWRFE